MARFKKAILKVGTYSSPDGEVQVTPGRLAHWHKQFQRLSDAEQVIPIDWDHAETPDKLQPLALADYRKRRSAKNTIGRLASFDVADDGQSASVVLDVRDQKASKAAQENLVYVSPVIFPSWRDGAGNEYEDCITHVDMVNHPVDHSQGKFTPVDAGVIACSLRVSTSPKPLRMSEDNDVADDDKKKLDDIPDDDDGGEEVIEEGDGEVNATTLSDVLGALANMQVVLPDDTTGENFLDRLHTALLTASAKDGNEIGDGGDLGEPDVIEQPDIAAMSLRTQAIERHAENQHRDTLKSRLEAVVSDGQCTPYEAKELAKGLPAVKLSLDSKTGIAKPCELEHWLKSREAVPKGTFWSDEQRLSLDDANTLEPPASLRGELSAEEQQAAVDFACGRKPK